MLNNSVIFSLHTGEELYHHGIAGQKWGVRNGPPYPLDQKSQKNNATVLAKQINKANGSGVATSQAMQEAGKKALQSTVDSCKKYCSEEIEGVKNASKIANEFIADDDLQDEYARKAAVNRCHENGDDGMEEQYINWFLNDDGDQGEDSSFALYCKDRGSSYKAEQNKIYEASKRLDNKISEFTKATLGDYGSTEMTSYNKSGHFPGLKNTVHGQQRKTTVANELSSYLDRAIYDSDDVWNSGYQAYWI